MASKRHRYSRSAWYDLIDQLKASATVYIGNQSFFTTEEQIVEQLSAIGPIRCIHMGLNRLTKEPCGFSFVEFYRESDAKKCVNYLGGLRLDGRPVKIDIDPGFDEGRQFGRGFAGGQVRDEFRDDYDYGRGGWGAIKQKEKDQPGADSDIQMDLGAHNGSDDIGNDRFRDDEMPIGDQSDQE